MRNVPLNLLQKNPMLLKIFKGPKTDGMRVLRVE